MALKPSELWYCTKWGNFYRSRKRSGSILPKGYRSIHYLGKNWLEHRLAFFFMLGEVPDEVDHRNRVKDDNRWSNLRSVSHRINNENREDNNPFIGVSWYRLYSKWIAYSPVANGYRKNLGYYKTNLAACYARWAYDQACA